MENPWVVGVGDHVAYHDLADCFRACAENDTCYRDNWKNEDAASATFLAWRKNVAGHDPLECPCYPVKPIQFLCDWPGVFNGE